MTRVHLWAAWFGALALAVPMRGADTAEFKEVYDLIRGHAAGVTESELNRAAMEGLLAKMNAKAWVIDSSKASAPDTNAAPVASSALFDENYGYIRIARIGPRLPEQFAAALDKLSATNKLKGLVIDLRYAGGNDYAAAAKVADRFLGSEQPLLDWGQGSAKSTDKTNAFRQPVTILVNHYTSGAAEALAGVLRQKDVGLLIGTNTAGQASITQDFPLQNGTLLRIAIAPVKAGDGEVVERLKPDIQVDVNPDDERAYFVDAYKVLPRASASGAAATNIASLTITNKPRKRINEAELVRMLREGESPEEEAAKARPPEPPKPVITDPALARAIDLLKALAVVRHQRA
jgi:C-terminal processing protease CtpA/Prc